jgi:hypothetical protein
LKKRCNDLSVKGSQYSPITRRTSTPKDALGEEVWVAAMEPTATGASCAGGSFIGACVIGFTLPSSRPGMKFLCDHCSRLLPVEAFRVEGATLFIRCRACRQESQARPSTENGPGPGYESDPVSGPERDSVSGKPMQPVAASPPSVLSSVARCPKCFARIEGASPSCRQCGLVYANFDAGALALSADVDALWQEAMPHSEDAKKHQELLELAQRTGELPLLARLFRQRAITRPEDLAAQRWCDEVARFALGGLGPPK